MFRQANRNRLLRRARVIAGFHPLGLQEWVSVVLGSLTTGIAIWSIEQARWIDPQPLLTAVLGLSVLVTLLLVKSRMSDWLIYLSMITLGVVVIAWQSISLFAPVETRSAVQAWWLVVSSFQPSESTTYFAMFLVLIAWMIGYISTWFILRKQNVWLSVLAGTVAILVNLSNLPRDDYYLLPIFLLVVMLLIGQANLAKQDSWFRKRGSRYPSRGIIYLASTILGISVFAVAIAWYIPELPVDRIGLTAGGDSSEETGMGKSRFNIFAEVHSKWSWIQSLDQEILYFKDSAGRGSNIHFVITANSSGYWRTRRYDTYHSWGWTNNAISEQTLDAGASANGNEVLSEDNLLKYTVENRMKTDIVLTSGELVSADIPLLLQTLTTSEVTEELTPSSEEGATTEAGDTGNEEGDVLVVVSQQMLKPYQRYTVVASTTTVTADELSEVGGDYPFWVNDYYLQLPENFPLRVSITSRSLTQNLETPYSKAMAINMFLNEYEHELTAEAPPEGVDGVDHFLFTDKKGTCVEFASAMVVMLRSAGVPARLCIGYLQDEPDEDTGNFVIRSRDYHAWAEVYFPGYGWVEFEATPGMGTGNGTGIISVGEIFADIDETGTDEPPLDEFLYGFTLDESSLYERSSAVDKPRKTWFEFKLPPCFTIIGISLLVVLIATLVLVRLVRRFRRVNNAVEAYSKMCSLAALGKWGPAAYETPLEYGARMALALPAQAQAINNISQAYMDALYSQRKGLVQLGRGRLQKSWSEVYPSLLKHLIRLRGHAGLPGRQDRQFSPGIRAEEIVPPAGAVVTTLYPKTTGLQDDNYHIICEDLFKIYKIADLEVVALRGLDLKVKTGELMAIIGASGSGKTSLLNILGGLDTPSAGKVVVGERNLLRLSNDDLVSYLQQDVGFVWQQVGRNLLSYLSAFQNVELPLVLLGWPQEKRQQRVKELLEVVGLANRMDYKPDRLSGGEQQRVAIAVALAHNPPLLLADEPTGELDSQTAASIFDAFRSLNETYGVTIVIVTHDISITEKVNRVVTIRDGRTSLEIIRKRGVAESGAEAGETVDEFVIVDNAGRLQIPRDHLEKLNLKERVRVIISEDHINILPGETRKGESDWSREKE